MDARIEPRLLRGFRDYLPGEMIPRQRMIQTIIGVFERFGFVPLQTPALEYADILVGKLGDDAEKLLYRFLDNGERDVCLRYDLTVPLARVAAQYRNLPRPIKRYQVAPVWRAEKPGRGRFREFYQCDVDIVGSASPLADAECLAIDAAVMDALGVPSVCIRVNNRKVLNGLASLLGVRDPQQMLGVFRTIDKLSTAGEPAVREMLLDPCGLQPCAVDRVFAYLGTSGTNAEILAALRAMFAGIEVAQEGLTELERVLEAAEALGADAARVRIDPSIARGLDYYTGTVFETFIIDLPDFGSVMSGGRYDGLISRFLGEDVPAVGISVGLDRLFAAMQELGRVRETGSTAQVLVAVVSDDAVPYALHVARTLRSAGLCVEQFLYNGERAKKQFQYADARAIPVVAVVGGDERETQRVTLKSLASGLQETVPLALAADRARALLAHSTQEG